MAQTTRREFLKTTSLAAAGGAFAVHATGAPGDSITDAALADADLQAWLDEAVVRHKVPGASVAIYHRGTLRAAAAGITNITTQVPVDTATVMHIGSITKVLNTTLVMQLVDEGLVDLEAPVIEYLPQWKVSSSKATRSITVKMLLNHSSGIDGELLPDFGPDRERVEDAIGRFAAMGQLFAAGTDTSYCNTAFVTAGYLVQRMRRKSWYTVVEEQLFDRLGLEHAIVQPADALLHRNTVGHFLDPETGELARTSHAFLPLSFAPAGATAMLSATDLVRFAAAHLRDGEGLNGERLLSERSARLMRVSTSRLKGFGVIRKFGLGWGLGADGRLSHGGGGPGILSQLAAFKDQDFAIGALTNAAHGGGLARDAINTWGQRDANITPVEPPSYPFTGATVTAARYVGTYAGIAGRHDVVRHEGGIGFASTAVNKFYDSVSLERGPVVALKPVAEDAFAAAAPGATSGQSVLTFVNPGADGRPQHLAMSGRLYLRRS